MAKIHAQVCSKSQVCVFVKLFQQFGLDNSLSVLTYIGRSTSAILGRQFSLAPPWLFFLRPDGRL